jgi:hypothetical protein
MKSWGNFKFIQTVELFLMFQTITLKNLTKLGHWEGHCFKFQSSCDWKSLKLWNGAGTPRTVTWRSPYATDGHRPTWDGPYPFTRGLAEKSRLPFTFLLAHALLYSALHCCPPLCLPLPATIEPPPCCPTGPKGAPQRRAPPAPSSSPGHGLPKPGNQGSCTAVYLREKLTVDRHHLSTSGLTTTSRRTAWVRSSTMSTPSPSPTFGPCRCPPAVVFPHRR